MYNHWISLHCKTFRRILIDMWVLASVPYWVKQINKIIFFNTKILKIFHLKENKIFVRNNGIFSTSTKTLKLKESIWKKLKYFVASVRSKKIPFNSFCSVNYFPIRCRIYFLSFLINNYFSQSIHYFWFDSYVGRHVKQKNKFRL